LGLPRYGSPKSGDGFVRGIPLEGMDLMINPKTQELVGVHGDVVELMLL
jgi:hypothetical protein